VRQTCPKKDLVWSGEGEQSAGNAGFLCRGRLGQFGRAFPFWLRAGPDLAAKERTRQSEKEKRSRRLLAVGDRSVEKVTRCVRHPLQLA